MTHQLKAALALLLCIAASLHVAQANNSWRVNANNKAEAVQHALATGLGFNADGTANDASLHAMFADWCNTYGLASPSDAAAFQAFVNNMRQVRSVNLDPTLPWWASGNVYSALTPQQFAKGYLGSKAPTLPVESPGAAARKLLRQNGPKPSPTPAPSPIPAPSPTPSSPSSPSSYNSSNTVNWVSRGFVTPIRNQGGCGSCWAFSSVAAIESMYLMSGRGNVSTLDLSEQQVVSCVTSSYGCSGGYLNQGLDYFKSSPVDKDPLWPYTATNGTCNTASIATAASGNALQTSSTSSYVSPNNDETVLMNAVLQSPVAFLMMVDNSFQSYAGGIYKSTTCTTAVNHAMLIVGWQYDATSGTYYWLIKNSWGTGWGEAGYIRMAAIGSGPGLCGMYQYAYKPPSTFANVLA